VGYALKGVNGWRERERKTKGPSEYDPVKVGGGLHREIIDAFKFVDKPEGPRKARKSLGGLIPNEGEHWGRAGKGMGFLAARKMPTRPKKGFKGRSPEGD